jgi:N-acetylglucosaminyldiphosphoundecaprenol N-acetyl-beta-D-mannosaminyltransferase
LGLPHPTGWAGRWRLVLRQLRSVPAADQAGLLDELARSASRHGLPRTLAFANAHAMNLASGPTLFADHLAGADVLLRDGAGLAMLMRWLGQAPGVNLNGTDLIPRLLQACDGQGLAVIGTRSPFLERGVATIAAQLMPNSRLCSADGFQSIATYRDLLQIHRPPLVLLAMGMPRQEAVALELRRTLNYPCLIVCGGAIVDFLAGKNPRAPAWLRRRGLEWLWRLGHEPRRLFKRYVLGNPLFVLRAVCFLSLGQLPPLR